MPKDFRGPLKNVIAKEQAVRSTLNELSVGQAADFPKERYDYVLSCRTRLQTTTGKRFTSELVCRNPATDGPSEHDTVVITRTE